MQSDPDSWLRIEALGKAVDSLLIKSGVALTMGGEPTFVPLKPEGAEWSTAAHGPTKLAHAYRFAHQLLKGPYAGSALLMTYGKQYPGEPLPRWALLIQKRKDGEKAWKNPSLLASELATPGKHTLADAEKLLSALSKRLALSNPVVYDGIEADEKGTLAGSVLPLDYVEGAWMTDEWSAAVDPTKKKPSLQLVYGESYLGLRLPLQKLPEGTRRRALTIEIRDGTLSVFIPPLILEGYLKLINAIETTLENTGLREIVLAGYAPSGSAELTVVGFASDPGVIEVNLSACASCADYHMQLTSIYKAATAIGFCARKLQFNGRVTGTGGGAHLVFGGPTAMSSPFFTQPTLLPSIVRYWQHHPALSYIFSGQYMGPSSQAPRIDESTFEALYELEIACEGAERLGTPWNLPLFDLLFRDLLMDRTGNTHRAEISVDKLWNPFSPSGQLGLIEFRAIETHDTETSLSIIAVFIRAIIARLAAAPFQKSFIRWGGELHDKFFLPTFIWENVLKICDDLNAHGLPFDPAWLRPIFEYRFPKLGVLKADENEIVFRQALEAWPLLGEQPLNNGATARTVDASLDRIEAAVTPELLEKGLLLVNGLPCEFRANLNSDEPSACGIRFRAFYLNPALHPHVPVHSPLLLEWVDKTSLTVLSAARWHAWNPKGVPYADRPTDEAAAALRLQERWEPWPHTVGQQRFVPAVSFPPEGRHTLDLRKYPAQMKF